MRSIFKRKINTTEIGDSISSPQRMNWFRRHKKLAIIVGVIAVILIGGGTASVLYFMSRKPAATPAPAKIIAPVIKPIPVKYYSPLTGEEVSDSATTTQPVTAVMIENSPDARPQSGLKNAGVVFEAIAEGGITRFAVLFQQEKPALIGPVRSVRMYFVDWLAAFNASIAHVGGSAAALTEVRNGNYRDVDEFFNGSYYYRATDRYAPHNVYTTAAKLDALNTAKGYTTSTFTGFTRKDSGAAAAPTATSMNVNISSSLYDSAYKYSAATNTYDRSEGGAPHLDREAGQLSPRVVIVMTIPERTILQDGYREQIDAIGSGKAVIFQDGTVQEVTWTKASMQAQITFTDATGKDVPLARGQTWLTSVPSDGGVTWQ